jgi:mono/diheme cytochrome c family protein
VAPNLAVHARAHDAATLEAAIRHGIGADGRALWSMPSYNFRHLSDEETAALIAFLQAAPVVASELPSVGLSFRVRWEIVAHGETHMAQWVAEVPPLLTSGAADDPVARGEHLAMTTCNECHGLDLRGAIEPDFATPDLAIVSAYPEADFRRLMAEGIAIGGRTDLGLMTVVAKDRFAHFTDQELSDLYAFLRTLPGRAIATDVFWRPME